MLWPLIAVFVVLALLLTLFLEWLYFAPTSIREGIAAGVAANILTTLAFTLIGSSTFAIVFLLERSRLFRFFGIKQGTPTVHVYTSRLEVQAGGAAGAEKITVGYVGPAIIRIEYIGGLLIRELFRSRILAMLPQRIKDALGRSHVSLLDVDPKIEPSPSTVDSAVLGHNLILIGSGVYNHVSLYYLRRQESPYYFCKNTQGERVVKFRCAGGDTEIPGRSQGRELGIIERINDYNRQTTIFICAGLGASASFGSIRYLAKNWKELQRKYGQKEFALCLAFDSQAPNEEPVVEPCVVHEAPISPKRTAWYNIIKLR